MQRKARTWAKMQIIETMSERVFAANPEPEPYSNWRAEGNKIPAKPQKDAPEWKAHNAAPADTNLSAKVYGRPTDSSHKAGGCFAAENLRINIYIYTL